jgi:hypothetical protein
MVCDIRYNCIYDRCWVAGLGAIVIHTAYHRTSKLQIKTCACTTKLCNFTTGHIMKSAQSAAAKGQQKTVTGGVNQLRMFTKRTPGRGITNRLIRIR